MSTLFLHGLGAVGEVWRGAGFSPDLPGHGSAGWDAPYSFEKHARHVLALLPDESVDVVGHSMGGVVALTLAGLVPQRVRSVVALGVKVAWTPEELDFAQALPQRPPKVFASRAEAAERFLKVSGLAGLVPAEDAVVDAGIVDRGDGWSLAQDPRTFGVGAFDMRALVGDAGCPVVLARGEHDGMVTHAQLADLQDDAVSLAALGHNAHVEDLGAILALIPR
ncbi:alpha/beta hydrolase [Ornithinimicrobium tianjinense]|uniref:Alpha/beta hydrolase n=2 Tax=Ornithinimicrobium tianjinense TaxID=1195761 RepID=A0A917F3Q2_9MICO|nr:alpha/beta hydrolase [Ornithinimicrobium tianjinense]